MRRDFHILAGLEWSETGLTREGMHRTYEYGFGVEIHISKGFSVREEIIYSKYYGRLEVEESTYHRTSWA